MGKEQFEEMDEEMTVELAVSYTHLDVYKRQDLQHISYPQQILFF